jgi:hypothetical protein
MNFKVKCVGYNCKTEKYFTIGKVYDVKDGHIFNDRGFDYDTWSKIDKTFNRLYEWFKCWYEFELVKEDHPEIHITVKGSETIAVYKNGTEYKKAVAKCSREDTFDFGVGAKLALERLGVLPTTEHVVEDKPLKLIIDEGDCGTVGEPTGYKDVYGKPLFVGDVVTHFSKKTQHDFGETVIVHRRNKFFVMGIEASCNDKEWAIDPNWVIVKVKDHSEMKRGDKLFHDWVKYV